MEGAGAAAIVPDAPLLNMLAAAAEPVDAAQPDELPAVPTAVGVAPDDEADGARVFPNDPRYLSACSIQPGCVKYTLAGWQPSSEKPAKKHLILAMGTRQLLPLSGTASPQHQVGLSYRIVYGGIDSSSCRRRGWPRAGLGYPSIRTGGPRSQDRTTRRTRGQATA